MGPIVSDVIGALFPGEIFERIVIDSEIRKRPFGCLEYTRTRLERESNLI